jgi:hypothetical protein
MKAMDLLHHDATRHGITLDALLVGMELVDGDGISSLVEEYQPTPAELKMKPQPKNVILFKRAKKSLELVCIFVVFTPFISD